MMLRHLAAGILLTTTVMLGQAASPTVVINEFVAINDSGFRDNEGDFSDWLELHNYGTETVDLTGAALTDSRKRLAKWTFPETKIEPGQYLVVFMSGKVEVSSVLVQKLLKTMTSVEGVPAISDHAGGESAVSIAAAVHRPVPVDNDPEVGAIGASRVRL